MICALLLAAGRSLRMGAQKLLLPFGKGPGQTVIGHIADEILRCPLGATFVVVGADAARVREALAGRRVTFVSNPDPQGDMLSSVRCGLRATPPDCEAVLVALGDQPALTAGLVCRMLLAFRGAGAGPGGAGGGILVPVYDGRRGHPILFLMRYGQEILTRYDGVGLRGLLGAHPQDVRELPVTSPSVLEDMDGPEDYRRELERLAGGATKISPGDASAAAPTSEGDGPCPRGTPGPPVSPENR